MYNRMQHTAKKPQEADEVLFDGFIKELAEKIMMQYEKPLLTGILYHLEETLTEYQIKSIIMQLSYLSEDEKIGIKKRKQAMIEDLSVYFMEHETASIDGLVLFRLKRYRTILEQVAKQLLDAYYAKKEYEEFLHLLRYFIKVQRERPNVLHLVLSNCGEYTLYNEKKEDITALCMLEFVSEDTLLADSMDDLLLSILITTAPQHLVLHNIQHMKNRELFVTIAKVFDTIEYCGGCPLCQKEKL